MVSLVGFAGRWTKAIFGPHALFLSGVVGVIVNLAVFFAHHVLWPQSLSDPFEWLSALIGMTAAVALFRFKVGVIPVVLACSLAGLALTFLRPLEEVGSLSG